MRPRVTRADLSRAPTSVRRLQKAVPPPPSVLSRATPQRGLMHRITRRPSPAMAVALFALFFAMGGGAYAAKHYLITSTKQISPKVLKALKGKAGKPGAAGATGPAGPAGA